MRKRWNVLLIAGAVMALAVGCGAKEETKSVQETSAVSETARTEGTTAHTEETEKAPEAEKKESEVQAFHAQMRRHAPQVWLVLSLLEKTAGPILYLDERRETGGVGD